MDNIIKTEEEMIKTLNNKFKNLNVVSAYEFYEQIRGIDTNEFDYQGLWFKSGLKNLDIKQMDEVLKDFDWNNYGIKGSVNLDKSICDGTAVMPKINWISDQVKAILKENYWTLEPYDSCSLLAYYEGK